MPLKSIDISLNINFLFILISILLISFYSYLIYKTTIPKVTQITKFVLILLRSLALFFIIILIFEPIIKLTYKKITEPNIYFFIDNSKSIAEKDSSKRLNQIISLINKLESINKNLKIFTFGSKPKLITTDSLNKIKLDEPITNFEKVISHLNNSDNIAAALILSDGIITDGPNPVYNASKFNFPIFTVGIGDTTTYKDVQIKDIIYNQITYTNKQTEIEAIILNTGFFNKSAVVSLFEENNLIQTKNIILSETGLNKIKFDYTPKKEGEVKLKISISQFN
ncbi:MAG: VWA domain-containing protein, partial [Melioribacter sp.]|nr:VWA domain-containing protein [Melioribacter sp.]